VREILIWDCEADGFLQVATHGEGGLRRFSIGREGQNNVVADPSNAPILVDRARKVLQQCDDGRNES
jgi:hypothetical protein